MLIWAVLKILTFLLLTFLAHRNAAAGPDPVVLEGKTMGTTYRILYFDEPQKRDFQYAVDSLLTEVNKAINTYDPVSDVSRFNRSRRKIRISSAHLYPILKKAEEINKRSDGAFDPTLMPLVNAWGFGPDKSGAPSARQVDSLKTLVGFHNIRFSKKTVRKKRPGIQLDFGGIGQGFGADVIFRFLASKGIQNMLIELGGEGMASGINLKKKKPWTIGILDPNSTADNQFFKAYVTLGNQAYTTSGNYFNYKVIDGRKFGHTIDPSTGYPIQHSLLSVSVFAGDCTTADGWATAFMVMGVEDAIDKVKRQEGMDAIFIYADDNDGIRTYITPGIQQQVTVE